MKDPDLRRRTKRFALDVIKFVEALPSGETCRILGRQLLRAGTSVGANYRAANRAKSAADFLSKMGTVEEEADESGYWLELLVESDNVTATKAASLMNEANELVAIAVASINTARGGPRQSNAEQSNAERGTRNAEQSGNTNSAKAERGTRSAEQSANTKTPGS